jgi:hypothetical protein
MKPTRLLAILAIAMVAGLLVTGCKDPIGLPQNQAPDANVAWHWALGDSFTIWAGQNQDAGKVYVWNSPDTLYIKCQTTGNWWLEQTHAHVAESLAGIPQKNGNPSIGQFDYSNSFSPRVQTWTYAVPFEGDWDENVCLYIATHCVVSQLIDGKYTNQQTGWSGPYDFPGKNWALYLKYCIKKTYKDVNLPEDSVWMKTKLVQSILGPTDSVSNFIVTLSGVPGGNTLPHPYEVWDGNWRGWCLELNNKVYDTATYRVKLYSDQDPNLPLHLQNPMYDNLNYLLNHKVPGATAAEIQKAIWYLMGDLNYYPTSTRTQQMIQDALTYGDGWHPGAGQLVGVLAHGKLTGERSTEDIQLVMLEVDP